MKMAREETRYSSVLVWGLHPCPSPFNRDSMVFSQYLQLALLLPFDNDLTHREFTLLKVRLLTIVEIVWLINLCVLR